LTEPLNEHSHARINLVRSRKRTRSRDTQRERETETESDRAHDVGERRSFDDDTTTPVKCLFALNLRHPIARRVHRSSLMKAMRDDSRDHIHRHSLDTVLNGCRYDQTDFNGHLFARSVTHERTALLVAVARLLFDHLELGNFCSRTGHDETVRR
jgi:hypothetical protein